MLTATPARLPRSRWSSSTAGGSPSRGPATRSRSPRRRPSIASGTATRTPSSRPRAATSACPTARWATPRSATSTSAPGRSSSRTWPGSTTRSPTAASSRTRRCWPPATAPAAARAGACTCSASSPTAACTRAGSTSRRRSSSPPQEGVPDVVFHAFTDGRDTLPHGGRAYLAELERWLRQAGRVGTVSGRYYAMDRDTRWERVKLAYDAIVHARGQHAAELRRGDRGLLRARRDRRVRQADGDRRLRRRRRGRRRDLRQLPPRPRARADHGARPTPTSTASRAAAGPTLDLTTMTAYRKGWPYPVAFPEQRPQTTLAEVISEAGGRQLHVAETEKYAHVTYFFNGGREQEWEGEERDLVDSPRDVPTYDHKPRDERPRRRRRLHRPLGRGRLPLRDHQLRQPRHGRPHRRDPGRGRRGRGGRRLPRPTSSRRSRRSGGACIVTADHGNCDHMLEPDGSPNTAHSLNPVPLIVTVEGLALRDGPGSSPTSPRRSSTCSASRSPRR